MKARAAFISFVIFMFFCVSISASDSAVSSGVSSPPSDLFTSCGAKADGTPQSKTANALGTGIFFFDGDTVSRAELVAIVMRVLGNGGSEGASYFDDDADIPTDLRPYIKEAAACGVVYGRFRDGALCFSPNEALTRYEAAKIAITALGAREDCEERVFCSYPCVPSHSAWALDAAYAAGLLDPYAGKPQDLLGASEAARLAIRLMSLK